VKQSNIETIDGIKGEWRTVTKASEVEVGQRVRYAEESSKFGFSDCKIETDRERFVGESKSVMALDFKTVQAFFPLADKQERKVAKVRIFNNSKFFWYEIRKFNGADVLGDNRKSKASALRGARRFCNAIGYEMEVVK
jgi:hypothetical protein